MFNTTMKNIDALVGDIELPVKTNNMLGTPSLSCGTTCAGGCTKLGC